MKADFEHRLELLNNMSVMRNNFPVSINTLVAVIYRPSYSGEMDRHVVYISILHCHNICRPTNTLTHKSAGHH